MYCPGRSTTEPIWRVLASSLGISSWTPLKTQHSNPNPKPNPLANQLWCIDILTPPTPFIIFHRLPVFLEGYYVEVLRGSRRNSLGRNQHSSNRTSRNAPFHNSILVTDYLTNIGINTVIHPPYSRDLAPCNTHTRVLPLGLAEVFGTVQQVHCSRRILLRRGQEFHVCTINKSAHTKKLWKLI